MWEYPSTVEWQNAKKKTIRAKNNQAAKNTQWRKKNETILVQKWDCKSVYYVRTTDKKKYSFYVNVCHKATLDIIEFRLNKVTDEFIFRYEKKTLVN